MLWHHFTKGKKTPVFQRDYIQNLFLNKRKNKTVILNKLGIFYTSVDEHNFTSAVFNF